eukprot:PITA_35569
MDVSYDCELNLSTDFEPTSFKEVASHDEWKEAMQKEYDALIKNGTWKLVDPPFGTKPISCKWVYKNKYKVDGSLDKHKARLVAKGFAQKERVNYEETFAPTTKWATIWILFALIAQNSWKVHQMDVKTAFLNGDLKENVFMSQPEGFAVKGHEHKMILVTGNNESYIASIKKELGKSFEMNDLGYVHYYLGIEVTQHPKSIFLSQKKYIGDLLNRFGMTECDPLTTQMEQNLKLTSIEGKEFEDATKYRQLVGSLNYLTTTRLDISFALGILSRYSDSDFNGDKETGVSTSGYAMSLGSGVVSLRSRKQSVPPDSTTEAEYVATAEATKEIVWLRKFLEDLQVKQVQSTPLMIDNTSPIKLAKNPKFHDRTKQINIKYHLIRHHVEAKTSYLRHCSTNEQIADIFTKALGREKLERFRTMLGLTNIPSD